MSYEIKLTAIVKTFGKNMTRQQMYNIINDALWLSKDLRDVLIVEFEGDFEEEKTFFSDIKLPIEEDFPFVS
jgi:hypothetical protein